MLDASHCRSGALPQPVRTQPGAAPSDETLLAQVAAGARDAFADLYDRAAPAVYGMAWRVVMDPSIAEEVTQDVLMEVWSSAATFDPSRGSAGGWILTMAHRRAVEAVRGQGAGRGRVEQMAAAAKERAADEVAEGVVDHLVESSRASEVDRALSRLPVLQRSAVEMAFFKGLTYRQVAEVLGMPLDTAKTRIRDGLRRLADQLGSVVAPAPDREAGHPAGGPELFA